MIKIFTYFILIFYIFLTHATNGFSQAKFQKHIIDTSFDRAAGIHADDIDGDGDVDIVCAGVGAGFAWWRNNGGKAISWTKQVIDEGFSGAISSFIIDVDGDGDSDVLGAAWDKAEISWYRNDGGDPISWTKQPIDNNFAGAHEVFACDFDGDGDADVFGAAGEAHDITWWRNDGGNPIVWTKQTIDGNFPGARSVHVADFDGDGDNDVVGAALTSDEVTWWRNDGGDPIIWTEHAITNSFDGSHRVYACDMDLDGDQDILGAAYAVAEIAWWRNDGGDPIAWTKQVIGDQFRGALVAHAADFDSDGDVDVVGTAYTGDEVSWWENEGGNPFVWKKHVLDDQINGPWPIYTVDVDGDGDTDIVAGTDDSDLILWWENINTFLDPDFSVEPATGHAPLTVHFSESSVAKPAINSWQWDFDNDGTIDSEEQNPSWTFDQPGSYSIRLVVSSDSMTEEFIKEDLVHIFDGGSALLFDGENSCVTCPATPNLNLTDAVTIEAWIKPAGWGSLQNMGFGRIVDKKNISVFLNGQGGSLSSHSLGVWLATENGSPGFSNAPENTIKLDEWQHVAVTYDGSSSTVKIYINGIEQTVRQVSGQVSGMISDNAAIDLRIGNGANPFIFDGAIDEVRIWNVVRDAADIQTHKNHNLRGNEPGLVGYWRMDEGSGEIISDGTGNQNSGMIDQAAWIQGVNLEASTQIQDKSGLSTNQPSSFSLNQNYPNPFNSTTTIKFSLTQPNHLKLNIFDINGKLVKSISDGQTWQKGMHSIKWDGTDNYGHFVSSGVYIFKMTSGNRCDYIKAVLIK